jgi:hypothetical protein
MSGDSASYKSHKCTGISRPRLDDVFTNGSAYQLSLNGFEEYFYHGIAKQRPYLTP